MMKRLLLLIAVVVACFAFASGALGEVKKATGSIELSDPAGDVKNRGGAHGKDVVKLAIVSNGKQIDFIATLKEPPGNYASPVVEIFFDTDNNPETGAKLWFSDGKMGLGYDYVSKLKSCIKYDNGVTACAGVSKAKVLDRFGVMDLYRYKEHKGKKKKVRVVASMGSKRQRTGKRTPVAGKVVQGVLNYEDLKVKPGQTIRILVWESDAQIRKPALFPEVLLTLK
jgi:hypothetical protein